ncbi:MAG TPA: TIGR04282 family arsenosugar biosynthesis glycosyltransferase [Pseudomonadales bacterium]
MTAILCIFARVPVLGAVKTRLAAGLGERAALDAHSRLVQDTLERLGAIDGMATELWVDRPGHPEAVRWAARYALPLQTQTGADLGERMHGALQQCHARGRWGLLVGTDCPTIGPDYLKAALAALDAHDVVLGPAQDGGYGLIGARRPVPELFREMPWGTSEVCAATLAAAAEAGLSVACLDEIWDVDHAADWRRYLALRGS